MSENTDTQDDYAPHPTVPETELYDEVYHLVVEQSHNRPTQVQYVKELFPNFTDEKTYDSVITTPKLLMYAEARGVGLDTVASAHASDMSTKMLQKILKGEGISLEKFLEIVKIELFSVAHTERMQLTTMAVAGAKGDPKAAEIALSSIMPYAYGKHKHIEEQSEEDVHVTYSVRGEQPTKPPNPEGEPDETDN